MELSNSSPPTRGGVFLPECYKNKNGDDAFIYTSLFRTNFKFSVGERIGKHSCSSTRNLGKLNKAITLDEIKELLKETDDEKLSLSLRLIGQRK